MIKTAVIPNPDEADQVRKQSEVLPELVGHQVRRAHIVAQKCFRDAFPDRALTSIQVAVLLQLAENREMRQCDLAKWAMIDPTILVSTLKRLETERLIERRRKKEDMRVQVIRLSAAGRAEAASAKRRIGNADRSLAKALTKSEKAMLLRLLHKITNDRY